MSALTNFIAAASAQAASVIGSEPITIGSGPAVQAVLSEVVDSREFSEIGMDQVQSAVAVIRSSDWLAGYASAGSAYVGKAATARGQSFRVREVSIGRGFVRVRLENINLG